jgi:hypothetical protein
MKRFIRFSCLILMGLILFSAMSFGFGPVMPLNKVYKDLSKDHGKSCYIIGKFHMTNLKDQAVADEDIASEAIDINNNAKFEIRIELFNTVTNKTYFIYPKPIIGSASVYYHNEKQLAANSKDPYWILKVPAGTYQIRDFLCRLMLRMDNYLDFQATVLDVPVAKVVKKALDFTAQPKQLIYIGDYDTTFTTFICLKAVTQIYTFRDLKIDLNDNFETFKTTFINGADDKLKEKLNGYEFISIFH